MKRDIIYSDGVLYYPLPEEGMYSVLVAQKDNSYKATGKIISIKEIRKEINAKKKASTKTKVGPVDNSKKKSADARKMTATLSDAVNAIKKKASTLPSQKEIDAVMASVMRQSLFGDKVIPSIVSTLTKIYKSVDKANQSIGALERSSQQYADPNYIKSQILKFNVAIAKKDKEIAVIESKRLALDTSSSNYTVESAELDLKESMVMSRFSSEVERMNDPLLSLRRNIVNRMDAMVSTIKSVTNSVNKLSNISVPNIDNRKLREIGRTINKTYAEAFRLLQNVNNGISIETIKASMGWKESGVNRYVTVTRYDDAGKPYNVYLTKKEFDQKTGHFTDKRMENPDYFVPHFEAEDAMTMVGSFISKVLQLTSSINKLGNTRIESPMKTSIRLRTLARQMNRLVKTTAKSFSDIDSASLRYAMTSLVGSETTIKKLILRYSSILDTVIETLNSKDLQSKRTKCSYVIHSTSTDLEAIVKMIDEMSALKQLSKKGTISKIRLSLIKESIIGLRDMLTEIADGYDGKIIEEGAVTVKAVSGTIPVFVSDIIFVLKNERKLKGKEDNIKNVESVMREYSRLVSVIVKMLSSYETTDVSKIDNITVVLMSLTASMSAFKKLSDSGKRFDSTDISTVETVYRLFSGKHGMLQLIFMLSSGIVKISKTGIGRVGEKALLLSIDKTSSFLRKVYEEFGYKKSQDKSKKSIDGLIEANKVVKHFLEIEKNLAIIGLLAVPATIGALAGTLVMVTTRMLIRTIRNTNVDGKGDKTTLEKGRDMLLVLGVVIQIEKELSIIGLLAIPATIGALGGTLVMVTTRMLIRTIRKTDVDGKGDKTTLRKALDMMLVLGAVVLIETELSVIGLLAVPAMVGVGLGTLVVLSLRILIRTISRTNLDGLGIKKGAVGKVMDMLLVVSAIGLIELELIAVGILAIPALIGAAAMGLVILGFSAIVVSLYVFKKSLAIGALVLAGICLALLLVGETFYALSSALKEWDWNLLWKIPLLVLDMAVPFLVLGIPVVAGLVALGAIVTIAIIYTYKEMIETVSKLKDINVEAAKKTISSTSEIIETMMSSLAKTSLWDFAQTEMSIINIRGTIENYSRIIDLVEKIADLKVPTGYDSEGNPTGYERANPSVFKDAKTTIKQLSGIMAFMTKELLSMDRAGSLGDYIGGKWKMGIVSRTAEPINRILDFIVKLNGPYRMPIYKTDENGNDVLDTSVGDKGYKQINIGTFIRTNSRPIMRTVKDLFKFAGNIGAMVQKMGQGEDTLVDTWRGKVRLKIISRALDPLNSVLDFIVKLNNVYDIPVYKKEDGREVLDTSVGNKGYIQTNLSSFLKQSKPDILNTIKDLMEFVTEIGDKIVTLGGGEEEDDGVFFGLFSKKNRDTRRGKRRLKVIAEAVDPLQSVLDFIVTMETGVVDVPVIKDGKIVMDEDGKTALTRPEKISTLVSRQKDAEKNVMQLVGVAIAIGNVVSRIANSGSAVKNIDEDAMSKVVMISEVISPLTEYATMFSTMKGQSPDLFKKDSADSMVSMTTDIVESVNKMFSLEILTSNKFKEKDGRIGSLYNRIKNFTELKHTKDFKNAVESTGDMVDSINSINDSKIDKLNTLMRNMIEFGNTMDEALENVFDKIVELAEELHYIIEANEKKQNPQTNATETPKPAGTQQTGTQQKQTVQQGTIQQRIDTSGVETRIDDLITIVTQIRQNIPDLL